MQSSIGRSLGRLCLAALGLFFLAAPASAQWTQVADIPTKRVFSIFSKGDTIAASVDTAVYLSTNAGAGFRVSAKPVAGVAAITAVWVENGRVYAGTFGQGAFFSDDLGASWHAFSEGLVDGFGAAHDVVDFQTRGDSIYAATAGAGVFVRRLNPPDTWHLLGAALEQEQSLNVNSLAVGGTRLMALAGPNGFVFDNDPGEADWTVSNLDNIGVHASLIADQAIFTGTSWIVGSNLGLFRSAAGEEPWTRFDPALGPVNWVALAERDGQMFASFSTAPKAVVEESVDDGVTFGKNEDFPNVFIQDLVFGGENLYAARLDGLWRRPVGAPVAVGARPSTRSLHFALLGQQPSSDRARLRFNLARSGSASIEIFDVHGRMVGDPVQGSWPSGPQEVSLDTRSLPSGVYSALLTVDGAHEVVRLVHVR